MVLKVAAMMIDVSVAVETGQKIYNIWLQLYLKTEKLENYIANLSYHCTLTEELAGTDGAENVFIHQLNNKLVLLLISILISIVINWY